MTDADTDAGAAIPRPHVLVPFDARAPKTRLADVLDERERRAFADAMLADVLAALDPLGVETTVLSTAPLDGAGSRDSAPPPPDVPVVVDERPLTAAVNARLAGDVVGPDEPPLPAPETPAAVVMADLPLVTGRALRRLLFAGGGIEDGVGDSTADGGGADVTMAPGLGGGTNALCVRDAQFRVDYHGASCRDHREAAREAGLELSTVDSFRLATDIDERADLVEVLLHGEGTAARTWLRDAGFALVTGDGRVRVARRGDTRSRGGSS